MLLEFKLEKQKLVRLDEYEIASFTRNYIDVTFTFDELWCNVKKYALFVTPNGSQHVIKLGYGQKVSCKIPNQVLENAFFKISVFGGDLLTSTQETVFISSSGYTLDIDDLEEGEIVDKSSSTGIETRQRHYDEEWNGRINQFEIEEHPYL